MNRIRSFKPLLPFRRHLSTPNLFTPSIPTLEVVQKMGDLKTLGLCSNSPVGIVEQLIEMTFVSSDLSWWGSIACATILARLLLFPIHLKSLKVAAKLHEIRPVLTPIQDEMKRLRKVGDIAGSKLETQKMMKLFNDHKISPLSGLIGIAQVPVFISFFIALQDMAHANIPGFTTGGFGIWKDLTATDPTYILPILSSLSILASMKLGEVGGTGLSPAMKNAFYIMSVLGVFFMSYLPAAVFMYTIPSGIFTLIQGFALRRPKVRAFFKLPLNIQTQTPTTSSTSTIAVRPLTFKESFISIREGLKAKA